MNKIEKELINNVMVQLSVNTAKINVLSSMVLGVYSEILPAENASHIYTNFTNALEKEIENTFANLGNLIFENNDDAFLLRQKMNHLSTIFEMKSNHLYKTDLTS